MRTMVQTQHISNRWRIGRPIHGPFKLKPLWGQGFRPAAELSLGAERHVSAGSTGDLVAGKPANRVLDRRMSRLIGRLVSCRARRANRDPARPAETRVMAVYN
jgi:hypothetical protein